MNITFAPRGILQIDEADIIYRNFSGIGSKFNREGDRNFAVRIDDREIADRLVEDGWNVKIKEFEDGGILMHLPVKIKFNERGPAVYLKTGRNMNRLDEESVDCLDHVDILSVDLDIRPYDWDVNGKTGRTAYLQAIHVTQDVDRFAQRHAEEEYPEEMPFN